jgi:hypothetical protein
MRPCEGSNPSATAKTLPIADWQPMGTQNSSSVKRQSAIGNRKSEICWPGARVTEQRTFNPLGAGLSPAGSIKSVVLCALILCSLSFFQREGRSMHASRNRSTKHKAHCARCSSTAEHSIDNRETSVQFLPPRPTSRGIAQLEEQPPYKRY